MLSYAEKLRDPRWQKVRLEVLDRASWRCGICCKKDKTLHVHHGYYEKGLDPWEYETQTLWSLCEDCHKKTETVLRNIREQLGTIHPQSLPAILGILEAFNRDIVNAHISGYEEGRQRGEKVH